MIRKFSLWQLNRKELARERRELAKVARYFDADYYVSQNPDLAAHDQTAFDHFMTTGWKQGFKPARWFDAKAYIRKYPDIAAAGINPFRHFIVFGTAENRALPLSPDLPESIVPGEFRNTLVNPDHERIRASGYFDERYYAQSNPDLAGSHLDAVQHFCLHGWREGRNPSRLFNLKHVAENFPGELPKDRNPLLVFLESDHVDTFSPNPYGLKRIAPPEAPADADWEGVRPCMRAEAGTTDIIVPVYRGYDETLRCLHSVLTARNAAPANLIVIDDCSPEPALSAKLAELAAAGLFNLMTNKKNLGFVGTVNRGMREHEDRDVVLLNSDTEVSDGWLDRLLAHAAADSTIATITPLSNNATICSYPSTLVNNSFDIELSTAEISDTAHAVNRGRSVDVPTGVGFCFYIRRAALGTVGYFDEAAFARGYGEENDFCVRAADAGWRNILALDCYVRHHGEVSFAADAGSLQAKGLAALSAKHPTYLGDVDRYIRTDPAREGRAHLDAARMKKALGDIALFVSHNWGGGIDRNMQDLARELAGEGLKVVVARACGHRSEQISFESLPGVLAPNLEGLHVHADAGLIDDILAILEPRLVHVHSLIAFTEASRARVMALIRGLAVPYYFTFHDYAPICAHGQFVTHAGDYCGEPGPEGCRACLKKYPPVNGWVDVGTYQAAYRNFIAGATGVFAPSVAAASRANAFLGQNLCKVSPHPELDLGTRPRPTPAAEGGDRAGPAGHGRKLRVAFVGAIGPHKGRAAMEACARDAVGRDLAIDFRLIGYSDTGSHGIESLTIGGKYTNDSECMALLAEYRPDFIAFLSIWPETYNYALSLAFRMNVAPVVFDIGAMADRVRAAGFGHCLPLDWRDNPARINDFLLANPIAPLAAAQHKALLAALKGQAPHRLLSDDFYARRTP